MQSPPVRTKRGERTRPRDSPASLWREKELLGGKLVDAGVVILQTRGCSHYHKGGCSMCGYNFGGRTDVTPSDVSKQFESATRALGEVAVLKIYTSGSFLDECEVPVEVADKILSHCAEHGTRVLFESRPEYVTEENIQRTLARHKDVEIALGLESANDRVLKYSINKGFEVKDYDRAAELSRKSGIEVRTYVLLKPPFLSEEEAMADAISTVKHAAQFSQTISINPVNVQKGTLVEKLWRSWSYRPPWLWSVLEAVKAAHGTEKKIVCDPVGGGKDRGAHNCGRCDDVILEGLKAFTSSQSLSRLAVPACGCRELWETIVDAERFVVGGTPDLQRFFRRHGA
jgi:radical SAM enzyme (TIGR01210 family)